MQNISNLVKNINKQTSLIHHLTHALQNTVEVDNQMHLAADLENASTMMRINAERLGTLIDKTHQQKNS